MFIWSNYYNIVLPLTFTPLYFGFCPRNLVKDICTKRTQNLHDKIPLIRVYYVIVCFAIVPYGSTNYYSSIT
jgi:hypothetical protein